MTEAEILKVVLTHVPTLGIVLGLAKIYMKITTFAQKIEEQVLQNRNDIETLIMLHIERHDEDAKRFIRKHDKG